MTTARPRLTTRSAPCTRLARWAFTLIHALLLPAGAWAQAAGCDQGVVRLPDRAGTITICSALAAQVPQLSRQLAEASRLIGTQGAQLRELTRLVKGLNAAGAALSPERQAQMLSSLSAELARAERAGGDQPRRTLDDLSDQLDALRDQLITSLGQERSAAATRQALQGPVGDSIAQLELRSASRQLDEIGQRLAALQSDVGEVKVGVATANETLKRIEKAVDPALAADRCADLGCAISEGASAATIQRLIDKGARLPANAFNEGLVLVQVAASRQADRMQILDILSRQGLNRRMMVFAHLNERTQLTPSGAQLAGRFVQAARLREAPGTSVSSGDKGLDAWNEMVGCIGRPAPAVQAIPGRSSPAVQAILGRPSGVTGEAFGITLLEMAALLGDMELFRELRKRGDELPSRELRCEARVYARAANGRLGHEDVGARLRIDPQSAEVRIEPL